MQPLTAEQLNAMNKQQLIKHCQKLQAKVDQLAASNQRMKQELDNANQRVLPVSRPEQ